MNGAAAPRPAADGFSPAPQVFEKAKVPLPPFQLVDLDQLSEKASGYFHSILTCPCGSSTLFEGFFFLSRLPFPFSLLWQGFPKRGSGERGLPTSVRSLPLATGRRPLHLPGWKPWDIPAPVICRVQMPPLTTRILEHLQPVLRHECISYPQHPGKGKRRALPPRERVVCSLLWHLEALIYFIFFHQTSRD